MQDFQMSNITINSEKFWLDNRLDQQNVQNTVYMLKIMLNFIQYSKACNNDSHVPLMVCSLHCRYG